jgi:hypothetical protein
MNNIYTDAINGCKIFMVVINTVLVTGKLPMVVSI